MKPELLEDVYSVSLQQALQGERAAFQAMPMMAAAAPPELREALQMHAEETKTQIERLEICLHRFKPKGQRGPRAQAIEAIIAEMREQIAQEPDSELAAVILGAGARKIEHLEISCYADLLTIANALGFEEDKRFLGETMNEERRMEEWLAAMAENAVEEAASLAEITP